MNRGQANHWARRAAQTWAWLLLVVCGLRAEPLAPDPELLYPPTGGILTNEWITVTGVCAKDSAPASLLLDGQPVSLRQLEFASGWPKKFKTSTHQPIRFVMPWLDDKSKIALAVATLHLTPGNHELALGARTNRLTRVTAFGADSEAKTNDYFLPHPSMDAAGKPMECTTCHESGGSASETKLGRVKLPDRCGQCHQSVDLRLAHSHVMEPLAKCSMCHDPHGTRHPKLLIAEPAKLCVQCHEAGHFKN
jgi:predicted CXXCH cytochrome family protein